MKKEIIIPLDWCYDRDHEVEAEEMLRKGYDRVYIVVEPVLGESWKKQKVHDGMNVFVQQLKRSGIQAAAIVAVSGASELVDRDRPEGTFVGQHCAENGYDSQTILEVIHFLASKMDLIVLEGIGYLPQEFCSQIRLVADEVNRSVRLGMCFGPEDMERCGKIPDKVLKTLAGKNSPFVYLAAEPFWISTRRCKYQTLGLTLSGMLAFLRTQLVWLRNVGAEFSCCASHWQWSSIQSPDNLSDTLRLCLGMSAPEVFENACKQDTPNCYDTLKWIKEWCAGKETGISVISPEKKGVLAEFTALHADSHLRAFPAVDVMLASQGIPYRIDGGADSGILFGSQFEKTVEGISNRNLILDAAAALKLCQMGIDVGIRGSTSVRNPVYEEFPDQNIIIHLSYGSGYYYDFQIDARAEVLSWFEDDSGRFPAAYRYQALNGTRYVVFAFKADGIRLDSDIFISYNRQRQLIDCMEWIGEALPAYCPHYPYLYMVCRESKNKLCVFLCNLYEDWIRTPKITLGKSYGGLEIYGGEAELKGRYIQLSKDIPPYGYVSIMLKK